MASFPIVWRFVAVGIIWGSGFMWNEFALADMSWQFLTWARGLIGASTLVVIMCVVRPKSAGVVWPRSAKLWGHFGIIGVLLAVIPNACWALAQIGTSSSLASIYNAVTPIATALIAGLLFRVDRIGARQWAGIALGISGVVLVIAPWETGLNGSVWSQLLCLVAVCSAAAAFSYQRKFLAETPLHPTTVAAMSTIGAGVVSVLLTPVWAIWPTEVSPLAWVSVLWLGALVGGFAYVWNTRVMTAWGATGASMVTYLSPIVGVTLGVALLGDTLSWNAPIGGLVIVAGIAVSQQRMRMRRAVPLSMVD